MKRISMNRFALYAVGVWLISACTSAPQLQTYPRRQLDRPYTLPKGVANWSTLVPFGYFSDKTGSTTLPPIPVPLFWKTSLSDDWTLNWAPLPLSVSHQISNTEQAVWGATFGMGFGYASSIGLVVAPSLSLYQRQKLGASLAWETKPHASAQLKSKGGPAEWSVGMATGPMFQLTEHVALTPSVAINVSRGYRSGVGLGDLTIAPVANTEVTIPLGLTLACSISRQWDLDASYVFDRIGHSNDYSAHVGIIELRHFW